MAYGITAEGFKVKPRDAILQEINDKFVLSFGATFDTSPESPDGQVIGIMADAVYESWLREELAYNGFIPSKAFGAGLDSIAELNGIQRVVDKPTTVVVYLTGTVGVFIPAGSEVETSDGLVFTTNVSVNLPASVTATHNTLGAVPIGIGEVIVISSNSTVTGWTGVNNPAAGTTGIVRQTDPEFRALRASNTINKGTSTVNAIIEAVASLNLLFVHVNDNDSGNTLDTGQPPNSIHVVVEGGNKAEVAEKVFANKPAGIVAWGTNYESVTDLSGNVHQVGIDDPVAINIEISVKILRTSNTSGDLPSVVSTALIDYIDSLPLGVDVDWSSMFEPILDVGGLSVLELTIAREGSELGTSNININTIEKSTTNINLITVVE